MLSVLRRRNPTVHVLLIPAVVQGEAAPESICRAFELAAQQKDLDVILFGRGGGSLEELWAFNDERVARAIYRSPVPTISAVGHEIDYTIADFVADCRGPTPSAAAELAVPEWKTLKEAVEDLRHRSRQALMRRVDHLRQRLKLLTESAALTQPDYRIKQAYQRVDDLIERAEQRFAAIVENAGKRLGIAVGKLESLSPLATLSRGYAICSREDTGEVIRDAGGVVPGDRLRVRLAKGEISCRVVGERSLRGTDKQQAHRAKVENSRNGGLTLRCSFRSAELGAVNPERKGAELLTSEEKVMKEGATHPAEAELADEPFEKQLERLEQIVRQLERGETPLEESVKIFEEGVRLARLCTARLDEIQGKIEVLLDQGHGDPIIKPCTRVRRMREDWSPET